MWETNSCRAAGNRRVAAAEIGVSDVVASLYGPPANSPILPGSGSAVIGEA